MQTYTMVETPIGCVAYVASDARLSHVYLLKRGTAEADRFLHRRHPEAVADADALPEFRRDLGLYFSGRPVCFSVTVDLAPLTEFQRRVLRACSRIPYGRTLTYGELARRIGCPAGARAVGGALARNPVPLVIPCHRVVAGGGALGGFSAEQGVGLKRFLLDLESRGRTERMAI